MNWEAIGAIGELLGSAAVLITLIYLARQITQNNRMLDENRKYAAAQAYQARTDTAIQAVNSVDQKLLAKLGVTQIKDIDISVLESLDSQDKVALNRQLQIMMIASDNAVYQREIGLIERVLAPRDNLIVALLPLWRAMDIPLRPAVQRFVDEAGLEDDA